MIVHNSLFETLLKFIKVKGLIIREYYFDDIGFFAYLKKEIKINSDFRKIIKKDIINLEDIEKDYYFLLIFALNDFLSKNNFEKSEFKSLIIKEKQELNFIINQNNPSLLISKLIEMKKKDREFIINFSKKFKINKRYLLSSGIILSALIVGNSYLNKVEKIIETNSKTKVEKIEVNQPEEFENIIRNSVLKEEGSKIDGLWKKKTEELFQKEHKKELFDTYLNVFQNNQFTDLKYQYFSEIIDIIDERLINFIMKGNEINLPEKFKEIYLVFINSKWLEKGYFEEYLEGANTNQIQNYFQYLVYEKRDKNIIKVLNFIKNNPNKNLKEFEIFMLVITWGLPGDLVEIFVKANEYQFNLFRKLYKQSEIVDYYIYEKLLYLNQKQILIILEGRYFGISKEELLILIGLSTRYENINETQAKAIGLGFKNQSSEKYFEIIEQNPTKTLDFFEKLSSIKFENFPDWYIIELLDEKFTAKQQLAFTELFKFELYNENIMEIIRKYPQIDSNVIVNIYTLSEAGFKLDILEHIIKMGNWTSSQLELLSETKKKGYNVDFQKIKETDSNLALLIVQIYKSNKEESLVNLLENNWYKLKNNAQEISQDLNSKDFNFNEFRNKYSL